ncbi:N-6 DNA methylase [Sulfurimonas sp.]
MKNKNIFDILGTLNLVQEQAIELYYLLKAWKIMSANDIKDDNLRYATFFAQKVESKKLLKIFETLSKEHNLFKFYLNQNSNLLKIDSNVLVAIYNTVEDDTFNMNVNDAFCNQKVIRDYCVSHQVAELGVKLLNNNSENIYVPFTNGFSYVYQTDKKIYAENQIPQNAFIAELIKIIDHKNIEFQLNNPLEAPAYINPDAPHLLQQFESVLSFPPLGLRAKIDFSNDRFNRFKIHKGSNLDVAHFEHILAQCKGKAVVLLPVGFTYRSGIEELFRKYLIEKNYLEAIVQLPPNIHSATSIETTFFVINKKKEDDQVLFINLKNEQFLKRDGRKIIFNNIDKIIDIYKNKEEINAISTIISIDEIEKNSYSLSIDRYVISQEAKEIQEVLAFYKTIELQKIAEVRRSQLFKDEGEGKEVNEISPSDFAKAGFTTGGGKLKKIGSQYNKYQTYKLHAYDVLVSTKGTIGKVAIIGEINEPLLASQASQVIRVKDKQTAMELYMFFKSDIGQAMLKQLVAGTAMPQIATSEIKKMQIPILSKDEKKQVLLNFNNEIELYNEIEKINNDIRKIHSNFLGEK